MKRIIFLGLCMAVMTSCNLNKKVENDGSKSDSISNKNDKMAKSATDNTEFVTPDLMLFDVKGHVKTVKYDGEETYTVTFDENGMLASCPCNDEDKDFKFENGKAVGKYFSSERNAKGQLTRYAYEPKLGDGHWFLDVKEITYNANGQVIKLLSNGWETGSEIEYKYNSEGLCIKQVEDWLMSADIGKFTRTYTYSKFDKQGNWIERKCKQHSEQWEEGEENNKTITNEEEVEKRTITYYSL